MAASPGRPDPWLTSVKLVGALLAAGILTAGLLLPYIGGIGLVAGHEADKFRDTTCTIQESAPPQKTTLYARDGRTVLATLFSQDRVPVPLSQIPRYLQDALVATEDRRFYSHHGVDMRGLLRSAVSTSSGDTQGGSTLTMQYVKQIRYYQAGDDPKKQAAAIAQNLERKIEDAKCALYFEGTLHESKGQILQNYLNIAFFGENSYGIQTAAETYFNKAASKLTLGESSMLVGLLRAPSAYDPFHDRVAAKQRRDEVLQNLVAVGKLRQVQADSEKAKPVALATQSPPQVKQGCANASTSIPNAAFFCEYATQWLKTTGKLTETQLETGGLKIVTTLDPVLQKSAQERVSASVPSTSPMTSVLPVVASKTGDILAMAASKRYGANGVSETEQPIFTAHVAQGASTFKVFPLLAALSIGLPEDWQLETAANTGTYKPINCATVSKSSNGDANETYNLNETLQSATVKSSNTYYVGLADHLFNCQLQPMVTIAEQLGMAGLSDKEGNSTQTVAQTIVGEQRAQQFVLGSVTASPLELAGAYAAIANGGRFNAPSPILSVTDNHGSALPTHRPRAKQVVAAQVAAKAVDILTGDTVGDGTSASRFDSWYADNQSKIAGKTGTNESTRKNQNSSIWFVGMTPNLVGASALINFDQSSAPSSGLPTMKRGEAYGDYAARIWLRALKPTLVHHKWKWPDPQQVAGDAVPDLQDQSLSEARKTLADNNFKMAIIGGSDVIRCPSTQATLDNVAYWGPHIAPPGSTITVCRSLGVEQPVFRPVIIKPKPAPTGTRSSTGAQSSAKPKPKPKPTASKTQPGNGGGTKTKTKTKSP